MHLEWQKLHGVFAILSAVGLKIDPQKFYIQTDVKIIEKKKWS